MPIVRFTGQVFPTTKRLTLSDPFTARWETPDEKWTIGFSIVINDSNIEVTCEVDRDFTLEETQAILRRATSLVHAITDLMTFSTGIAFSFILDRCLIGDQRLSILIHNAKLGQLCTAFGPNTLGDAYALITREIPLFMALNDLTAALADNLLIAVNCGRVVEALRKLISEKRLSDEQKQWAVLRANLNLSKDYLKFITDNSREPRHGNRMNISAAINSEILCRTWTVTNRFLEFRKRNNAPLPEADFPQL